MRKLLAVILVLSAAVLAFAGGGKDAKTSDGSTEIEVWVYEEFYRDGETSALAEATKAFMSLNPDIKVTITPLPPGSSAYRDKFIQAANGGSGPDAFLSDNVWVPQLAAMELIIPLTNYLGNKKNEYFPGPIEAATLNNQIYGIPFHSDAMVLYYNKDMFRAAGLDPEKPPTTWDEFRDYSIRLTRNGKAGFALLGGWGGSFEWLPWLWQNSGDIIGPNGKVAFNSPAGFEATEFFLNLLIKDKVIPEAALTWKSWDELAAGFVNQTFAMAEGMDVMLQILGRQQISFDWGVAELPAKKTKASMLGGGHWAINRNSKNADAAYKWIDFISSKEQNLKIMDAYSRTSSRVDSGEQKLVQNDPKKKVCVATLGYARPRPIIPEWTIIDYDCIQPAFMRVIFEGEAIRSSMLKAEEQANAALAD